MNFIITESTGWLAVNKPGGISVEKTPGATDTVEDQVWAYLIANQKRPFLGIVHRLDRVTSGLLLLAKKRSILKQLNEQFQKGLVKKTYLAIVEHRPEVPSGLLRHWLVKDQKTKMALAFGHPVPDGVECILHYRIISVFDKWCLLEVRPQSGKFHQIRAQLSAAGNPILGDTRYGATQPFSANAIALHAWKLEFIDPETGISRILTAPLPDAGPWGDVAPWLDSIV